MSTKMNVDGWWSQTLKEANGFERFLADYRGNTDGLQEEWNRQIADIRLKPVASWQYNPKKFIGYQRTTPKGDELKQEVEALISEHEAVMERVQRLQVSQISSPVARAHATARLQEAGQLRWQNANITTCHWAVVLTP